MEQCLEKFQTNSLVTFFKSYLLYTFNRFSDHTRNNIFKRIIHILWTHIIKGCKCNFLYLEKKTRDRSPVIQEIHVFWLVVGYRKWTDSGGKAGRDGKFLCSGQFWHVSHTTQITHRLLILDHIPLDISLIVSFLIPYKNIFVRK